MSSFCLLFRTRKRWWLAGGITPASVLWAYQAKNAASQAASYVNLANPGTYNLTATVAPTWTAANGWAFTGTEFLKTGFIPATLALSMFVRFSGGTTTGSRCVAGAYSTQPRFFSLTTSLGNTRYYALGDNYLSKAGGVTGGVMGFAGRTGYLDGTAEGAIPGAGDPPAYGVYIGGRNDSGVLNYGFSGNIQAAILVSGVLSPAQALALTRAMSQV